MGTWVLTNARWYYAHAVGKVAEQLREAACMIGFKELPVIDPAPFRKGHCAMTI
jgi:hypothetical protein